MASDRLMGGTVQRRRLGGRDDLPEKAGNSTKKQEGPPDRCGQGAPGPIETDPECRRRDSNPRHADYDSAALTD